MKYQFALGIAVLSLVSACDSQKNGEADGAAATTSAKKAKAFNYKDNCGGELKAADIPSTPIAGSIDGSSFESVYGKLERKGQQLNFFSLKASDPCGSPPLGKEKIRVGAKGEAALTAKTYTKKELEFTYTKYGADNSTKSYALVKSATLVIDKLGPNKGDKVTGKIAVCFEKEGSFFAGTFEASTCSAK